jgi:hypothetical protein
MKGQLDVGVVLDPNMVQLSRSPARNVYVYESMWAYQNHYRVDMEFGPMHLTYDFGVACIFRQPSRSSTKDENMVMANLNYVNILKVVVDYLGLLLVLFKCSWILANTQSNITIWQDEYGFWVVNFAHQLLPMVEPYVFPAIVNQVRAPLTRGSQFFDYKVLDTIKLHVEADIHFSINYVHINYRLMLQTQLYGNVGDFCVRHN